MDVIGLAFHSVLMYNDVSTRYSYYCMEMEWLYISLKNV